MGNQIFVSYSHRDKEWLARLETVLKPYIRSNNLSVWNDSKIHAGEKWQDEIRKALAAANVAVLLVTSNFLASDFIAENELPPLLAAAEQEGLTVLWVAVGASGYKETEIAHYQAVNDPAKPLNRLNPAELDEALVAICEQIKAAAGKVTSPPLVAKKPAAAADSIPTIAAVNSKAKQRVVLVYKRNSQPDEYVLKLLEQAFSKHGCDVFVDRHLPVGVEWAREIERQVRGADFVVPLLSTSSVLSEMFTFEIQIANDAAQQQKGQPRLLPVRINYKEPLPDPLASLLDPIQQTSWNDAHDDQRAIRELLNGLETAPVAAPISPRAKLEVVGGAVPLDSAFYIVRPQDREFSEAIARRDSIVLVKGARQMGKTSLLARGLQQARAAGAKAVLTDLQKFNAAQLASVEAFFLALGEMLADQLDLPVSPEQVWNQRRGPSINFDRYLRREVLGALSVPLIWGMDEVDRLFACDFGSEVFGLLRSWHNERSLDPEGPWQRLTLVVAYATEAHLFITDINQSPFNVGTRLALSDFTLEQVAELNRRYGSPLRDPAEVARFYRLVGGHPYLVRRGLHELVTQGLKLLAFETQAARDEGPFGDHLRRILVLLAQDPALCESVRSVLRDQPSLSMESFYRLRSAGVMVGEEMREVRPRCQLYATYLEGHLL